MWDLGHVLGVYVWKGGGVGFGVFSLVLVAKLWSK